MNEIVVGASVATAVLGVVGLVAKAKYDKVKKVFKELGESLVAISEAWEDDVITPEETQMLLKEIRDVYKAAM